MIAMYDQVQIIAKGGDGGDGAISFRREKFVPRGGPDGGNGGPGGNVVIAADPSINSLRGFDPGRLFRAANGTSGRGNRRQGATGADRFIGVPFGTLVYELAGEDKTLLADLDGPEKQVVVAKGGRGGFGNVHYASATNQAPRIAQKGEKGEQKTVLLEMRLIADIGIIGRPNAGKSSLISRLSAARPEIAGYPFTTKEPVLGVAQVDSRTLVLAEIPGLIEEAHLGKGLGHAFLRHALRTRALIHLVDGTAENPVQDYEQINHELQAFSAELAAKPQVVGINKIDLPEVRERMDEIRAEFNRVNIEPVFTSTITGEGITRLISQAAGRLAEAEASQAAAIEKEPARVFRPRQRRPPIRVRREGDVFVVDAPELERIVARVSPGGEINWELHQQFIRLGLDRALDRAGARPGDKIRMGVAEWEW